MASMTSDSGVAGEKQSASRARVELALNARHRMIRHFQDLP
jgi:hypothetical protein